jgi:hypothetical protein
VGDIPTPVRTGGVDGGQPRGNAGFADERVKRACAAMFMWSHKSCCPFHSARLAGHVAWGRLRWWCGGLRAVQLRGAVALRRRACHHAPPHDVLLRLMAGSRRRHRAVVTVVARAALANSGSLVVVVYY